MLQQQCRRYDGVFLLLLLFLPLHRLLHIVCPRKPYGHAGVKFKEGGERSRCAERKGLVGAVCNVFVAACVVAAATSAVAAVAARECFLRHGMGERFHCFGGTLLALLLVCRLGVAYPSDPCAGVFLRCLF